MTVWTSRIRMSARAILALAGAVVLTACGGPAGPPRPTDPRQILLNAVSATASLPTLRLHGEVAANVGAIGGGGQANGVMTMALDADIDLATRQFVGRATMKLPQGQIANGGPANTVSDVIVTRTATFNRDSQTGRWSKFPTNGIGGPTNVQVPSEHADASRRS